MSQGKNNGNPIEQEVRAEIKIQFMANGQIMVNGPIQDKVLMFGMLECAKDAVREFSAAKERSLIAPVTLMPKFGN